MEKKTYSAFYLEKQLNIDKALIRFRYRSVKQFLRGRTCLEMGPADGVMTELLVNDFENIHIVDGDKKLLDSIPPFKNVKKIHSWFEEFEPPQKYDTIIMEHVLEHISEPVKVLQRVANWLDHDGVVIVGVPNAKSLHRLAAVEMGLLKSEYELNDRDFSLGHRRIYDMEMLQNEVESVSLEIIHRGGVFLKPVSNKQIEDTWSSDMIDAFYELGKRFQQNTADIFIVATNKC